MIYQFIFDLSQAMRDLEMSITQTIYVSTASRELTQQDLKEILDVSFQRNNAAGISGLLLHVQGNFIQVLEGQAERMEATMQRIVKDSRHHNLFILSKRTLVHGEFSKWSMHFHSLSRQELELLPGYVNLSHARFAPGYLFKSQGVAYKILKQFYETNY